MRLIRWVNVLLVFAEMISSTVSDCGGSTCDHNAICITPQNGSNSSCVCLCGFTGNGTVCADVDECKTNSTSNNITSCFQNISGTVISVPVPQSTCSIDANCTNLFGSFTCTCKPGFVGNGTTCSDVNECTNNTNPVCAINATCNNTEGSFACSCNAGYSGNGTTCIDIDECINGTSGSNSSICDVHSQCNNTVGSFVCTCNSGFTHSSNQSSCLDINECLLALSNCDINANCSNTQGSFSCLCNAGYSGNGTTCIDINECINGTTGANSSVCGNQSQCNNTVGSFMCTCNTGFAHASDQSSCLDINECLLALSNCDMNANCSNTQGSFSCSCNSGYVGNGSVCTMINLCTDIGPVCDRNAQCTSSPGSFSCSCNTGFSGNGTYCSDINECEGQDFAYICPYDAHCNNTVGSFTCPCDAGYTANESSCVCEPCSQQGALTCDENGQCCSFHQSDACACNAGFTGNGTSCTDIDECSFPFPVCGTGNSVCYNYPGFFYCDCAPGFGYDQNYVCSDVDECISCQTNDCDAQGVCTNTEGSYFCNCSSGFYGNGLKGHCMNPCVANLDQCDSNSTCKFDEQYPTTYICSCKRGFVLSSLQNSSACPNVSPRTFPSSCIYEYDMPDPDIPGVVLKQYPDAQGFSSQYNRTNPNSGDCVDFNECLRGSDNNCDNFATCTNTLGSYTCKCNLGYNGTGINCTDIDECARNFDNCDFRATCFNTPGSFDCVCNCGFQGNGTSCYDENECEPQYIVAGVNSTNGTNYSSAIGFGNITTANISGALSNTSFPLTFRTQVCATVVIKYKSVQKKGNTTLVPANVSVTVELPITNNCDVHAQCNNTFGSFVCSCFKGFKNPVVPKGAAPIPNGTNCSNINECVLKLNNCAKNATCTDTIGSFTCACNAGYSGNGTFCTDINECLLSQPVCRNRSTCFNTIGSFFCLCSEGFFGNDPTKCQECLPGSYKNITGARNCTLCASGKYNPVTTATNASFCIPCPSNSLSVAGSTNISDCKCNAGYSGLTLDYDCLACPGGTYKSSRGESLCALCRAGKYTDIVAATNESACKPCPQNSSSAAGGFNRSACLCDPGYTSSSLLLNGTNCTICPPGTYKTINGSAPCQFCRAGKYSERKGSTSAVDCQNCTFFSNSSQGSDDIANCTCNVGYSGSYVACTICPVGTYKNVTGSSACVGCPKYSNSPQGSIFITDCSCNAGYRGSNGGNCFPCDPSYYSPGLGDCLPCPGNMTSDVASVNVFDCACNAGFFGYDGDSCTLCPAGKYKYYMGSQECDPCPVNSFSKGLGNIQVSACLCNAGYAREAEDLCQDIDECNNSLSTCTGLANCVNTEGSFYCACPRLYFDNGTSCFAKTEVIEVIALVNMSKAAFLSEIDVYLQALATTAGISLSDVEFLIASSEPIRLFSKFSWGSMLKHEMTLTLREKCSVKGSCFPFSSGDELHRLQNPNMILHSVTTVISPLFVSFDLSVVNATRRYSILSNEAWFSQNLNFQLSLLGLPSLEIQNLSYIVAVCGDGVRELTETCDDGNSRSGDGCSGLCQIEPGYDCSAGPCRDINECATRDNTCSQYASCTNTNGSFICTCLFFLLDVSGDGTLCVDYENGIDINLTQSEKVSFSPTSLELKINITGSIVQDIAFFEDTLLVGWSGSNVAFVYERMVNNPWPATPSARLQGPSNGGTFGTAVALSQYDAIVGTNSDCAYIFSKNRVNGIWNTTPSLTLCMQGSLFGSAVAINTDEVLIGAYSIGRAFLYRKNSIGHWLSSPSFTFQSNEDSSFFSHCLSMTEDLIAIGSLYRGKLFLYAKLLDGNWSQVPRQIMTFPYKSMGGSFSVRSLSMTSKNIFVGVPYDRTAYVFVKTSDGSWPAVPSQSFFIDRDMFGYCLSSTDLFTLITSYMNNEAYLFTVTGNGSWVTSPIQRLSEGNEPARFAGYSCSMTDYDIALGSFQDSTAFIHVASCAIGFYGWSINLCQQCPIHMISPLMSRLITDCVCVPGYYGPAGGPCVLCPINFYCPGGNNIIACTGSSRSQVASTSVSDCRNNAFNVKFVQQSTNLPGVNNTLAFTISPNNDFDPFQAGQINITIHGIICVGGCTPCNKNRFVVGCSNISNCPFQFLAFQEGAWTLDPSGRPTGAGLYVNLTQKMNANAVYQFSICIVNPTSGQYAPSLSIIATRARVFSVEQAMDEGVGEFQPLSVLGFAKASIQQSTSCRLANNTITASLTLYSFIHPSSKLIISGLFGAVNANEDIPISVKISFSVFQLMGKWNATDAAVSFTLDRAIIGNVSITLTFILQNSNFPQSSPSILIAGIDSGIALQPKIMSTLVSNQAILRIAGFFTKSISQGSTIPDILNSITVTLRPIFDLTVNSSVTVSGLLNSRTGSGVLSLQQSFPPKYRERVDWNQATGSLTLTVAHSILQNSTTSFTVFLLNPDQGQNSPPVHLSWSNQCGFYENSEEEMLPGSNPPLLIAGFQSKNIGQITAMPSCDNALFITINMFVPLVSDDVAGRTSTLMITGLTGTSHEGKFNVSALWPDSRWWNRTNWNASTGTLELQLGFGMTLASNTDHVLRLEVTNGQYGQFSPRIFVSATGPGWNLPNETVRSVSLDYASGDDAPLLIAGFSSVNVNQSTAIQSANNTITLTFSLFSTLSNNSLLTISGFSNVSTDSGLLPLQQEPVAFNNHGSWDRTNAYIVLYSQQKLLSSEIYTVKFVILNPLSGSSPANILINTTQFSICERVIQGNAVDGPGNYAPLLIAAFSLKSIRQDTASEGSENALIIDVMTTVRLVRGCTLLLSGLKCARCDCLDCCKLSLSSILIDGNEAWNSSNYVPPIITFQIPFSQNSLMSSFPLDPLSLLVSGEDILAEKLYSFNFSFLNPTCGQSGVQEINISVLPSPTSVDADYVRIYPAPMILGQAYATPFLRNYFMTAEIVQSTTASSAINNITVNFATKASLRNATAIAIGNLLNSLTGSGPLSLYGPNASSFEYCIWDQDQGIITAIFAEDTIPNSNYDFHFLLRNPRSSQMSPVVSITALDPKARTSIEMTRGNGALAPFLIVEFVNKSIRQSSFLPGKSNNITISFSVSMDLPLGSIIALSGLLRSSTVDQELVLVAGSEISSVSFRTGMWQQTTGTLSVRTFAPIIAFKVYNFTFSILNPLAAQPAIIAKLSVTGDVEIAPTALLGADGIFAPLLVTANFTVKRLGQSTPSIGVRNLITVTLSTAYGILTGPESAIRVTIEGISGTNTQAGALPLRIAAYTNSMSVCALNKNSCNVSVVDLLGTFSDDGSLVFDLENQDDALEIYKYFYVEFNITNGDFSQMSPTFRLGSAEVQIPLSYMDRDSDNHAPLLIAGFLSASIFQSTPSQGAANNSISLTFSTNCNLTVGSQLLLSGLRGLNLSTVTILLSSNAFSAQPFFERIVFTVLRTTPALKFVSLSLIVENPAVGQDAPSITIAGVGDIKMASFPVVNGYGNEAALLVADFEVKQINQSSVVSQSPNMYTVLIRLNADVHGTTDCSTDCSIISIFGLTGSSQKNVLINQPSNIFDAIGTFAGGNLTVPVIALLKAGSDYAFSFSVENPVEGLDPASVSIAARGEIVINPSSMSPGVGNSAPGLVAGFYTKQITQSTTAQARPNTIYCTVALNIDILETDNLALNLSNFRNLNSALQEIQTPLKIVLSGVATYAKVDFLTGSLSFPLTISAARKQLIGFFFTLRNPTSPQNATAVSIQLLDLNGNAISSKVTMDNGLGNLAPLSVTGFYRKEIFQSTTSAFALNNITVEISSYDFMFNRSSITISGLTGSSTSSNVLFLNPISVSSMSCLDLVAAWNNTMGLLVLRLSCDLEPYALLEFSFSVRNGLQGQSSPVVFIEANNPNIALTKMDRGPRNSAPLAIAGFAKKAIGQSNPSASADNTISVTLSSLVDLPNITSITISNLLGSVTEDSANLTILSNIFDHSGIWKRDNGTLILSLKSEVIADTSYVVSFLLRNPSEGQESPAVSVEASGIDISKIKLDPANGNAAPLLVARFTVYNISQTDPSAGANNSISAFVAVNLILNKDSGTVISITGITGSKTQAQVLPIKVLRNGKASSEFGSSGSWEHRNGTIKLTVQNAIIYPVFTYQVTFNVQNPDQGQPSPEVFILASGINFTPTPMIKGLHNSAPMLVAGFLQKHISQSTPTQSSPPEMTFNTITVAFSTFASLLPASNFTISGLDGSAQTSTENLHLMNLNESAVFMDKAIWDQAHGQLIARLRKRTMAEAVYVFSFLLRNPEISQDSPVVSIKIGGRVNTDWAIADPAEGNNAPLVVSGFEQGILISQSDPSATAQNTITVEFETHVALLPGTTILISGLAPVSMSSQGDVSINGNFSTFVGGKGSFNSSKGILTLSVLNQTKAHTDYVFEFVLRNPEAGQPARSVYIECRGTVEIQPVRMNNAAGNKAPLLIAGFQLAEIGQSSPWSGDVNIITITLACYASLFNGSTITISGLTGSVTRDTDFLPVNSSVFDGNGSWQEGNGTLILKIVSEFKSGSEYTASFELMNPTTPQASPSVSIEGSGMRIIKVKMISGQENHAPLLIAGFIVRNISQSSPSAGSNNTLTVVFVANVVLSFFDRVAISIAGLKGTRSPDDNRFPILSSPPGVLSTFGFWKSEGTLIIESVGTLDSNTVCNFSFVVINPIFGQDEVLVNISASVGVSSGIIPVAMMSAHLDPNSRPLNIASFLMKSISQSNPSPNAKNTITVSVSFSVSLPRWSAFVISGLTGSATNNTLTLPIFGNDTASNSSGIFESVGIWNQTTGTLTVQMAAESVSRVVYVVTFLLRNPPSGQDPPPISFEIRGPITITKILADPGSGSNAPLVISDMVLKMIGQSTPQTLSNNTLTATIAARIALLPGTTITVSGLYGPLSQVAEDTAIFGNFSSYVGGVGRLNLTEGKLMLDIENETSPEAVYVFSFIVENPSFGQQAQVISIEASGAVQIIRVLMDSAIGFRAPLLLAGFDIAFIKQSQASQNRSNTLSIIMSSFVNISSGTIVTINGLSGSITMDNNALPVNSSVFAHAASWKQQPGMLSLTISKLLEADFQCSFSFTLINPPFAQRPRVVSIEARELAGGFNLTLPPKYFTQAEGLEAPLLVTTTVLECFVAQSTAQAGVTNTINLTLRTTDALQNGTAISLTGLIGSSTQSSSNFSITSDCNNDRATWTASWLQNIGRILIVVPYDVPALTRCTFSFELINPEYGQDTPSLSVESSGVAISPTRPTLAGGSAAPFLIADFVATFAEQTSPYIDTTNSLIVSFATRTSLIAPANLTLSGLSISIESQDTRAVPTIKLCLNSSRSDCRTCSSNGSAVEKGSVMLVPACSFIEWNTTSGIFKMQLENDTKNRTAYAIFVSFRNPSQIRAPASIYIATTGMITIAETMMSNAAGNAAPLFIAGWLQSSLMVEQTTTAAGAINSILFKFAPQLELRARDNVEIMIAGLTGSDTPSGNLSISAPSQFQSLANWNSSTGSLLLTILADLSANIENEVIIFLRNPMFGRAAVDHVTIEASDSQNGVIIPALNMVFGQGNAAPLLVAGFIIPPALFFSNSELSQNPAISDNEAFDVTLFLQSQTELDGYFGTKLTLSGLLGSSTPGQNTKLNLLSAQSSFGPYGRWFQDLGLLTLIVMRKPVNATLLYGIDFPLAGASSLFSSLSTTPPLVRASYITLYAVGPLISSQPLFVPAFVVRTIGVVPALNNTPNATNATNWLNVTLAMNLDVTIALRITLLGFTGSSLYEESVDIKSDPPGILNGDASWNSSLGMLIIETSTNLSAQSMFGFQFRVDNANASQASSNITISATCFKCDLEPRGSKSFPYALGAGSRAVYFPPIALHEQSVLRRSRSRRSLSSNEKVKPSFG